MSSPYDPPLEPSQEFVPRKWPPLWPKLLLGGGLLVVIFLMLLPIRRTVPGAARRSQCSNNLKQIALGLQNYHDIYHSLPPAYTMDAEGKPLHSWRTLILPFIEQQQLYDSIDLTKPWDDPANAKARDTIVHIYHCPSTKADQKFTVYLANATPGGCFPGAECRKFGEFLDGTSNTILVAEVPEQQAVHWMNPLDSAATVLAKIEPQAKTSHPGGFQVAIADCSDRFIPSRMSPHTWQALLTISGGEEIADDF